MRNRDCQEEGGKARRGTRTNREPRQHPGCTLGPGHCRVQEMSYLWPVWMMNGREASQRLPGLWPGSWAAFLSSGGWWRSRSGGKQISQEQRFEWRTHRRCMNLISEPLRFMTWQHSGGWLSPTPGTRSWGCLHQAVDLLCSLQEPSLSLSFPICKMTINMCRSQACRRNQKSPQCLSHIWRLFPQSQVEGTGSIALNYANECG